MPKSIKFEAFAKQNGNDHSLLLHSSDHSTIDYTATENENPTDKYLKHYAAVFDPESGELQITEARRMTVRSSVRQQEQAQKEDDSATEITPVTNYSSRAALTHAFGTKKSKKAVASIAENALRSSVTNNINSPMSQALLSSMPTTEIAELNADSTSTVVQANKPLPIPDLTTNDITQVYPLTSLVFPSPPNKTLARIPVNDWKSLVAKKKPIEVGSRFVAVRSTPAVMAVTANQDLDSALQTLQLLRYILILVELAFYLKTIRSDKRIPPLEKWSSRITTPLPPDLLSKILDKFCPNGLGPSKTAITLLQTTILALTLHIPPPSGNHGVGILATEPFDIQQDLNLNPNEIRTFFRELGCKWEAATEAELERWGLVKKKSKKEGGAAPRFAKLKFPIEFPKMSRGKQLDRRR